MVKNSVRTSAERALHGLRLGLKTRSWAGETPHSALGTKYTVNHVSVL